MPIYEYKCRQCGKSFEKLVLPSDKEVCCTACDSPDVEKLASGFSMVGGGPGVPSTYGPSLGGCGGGGGGFS